MPSVSGLVTAMAFLMSFRLLIRSCLLLVMASPDRPFSELPADELDAPRLTNCFLPGQNGMCVETPSCLSHQHFLTESYANLSLLGQSR